jgi:hypothetical protein
MKPLQFIGAKRSFKQEKSCRAGSFFTVKYKQSNLDSSENARCFDESIQLIGEGVLLNDL